MILIKVKIGKAKEEKERKVFEPKPNRNQGPQEHPIKEGAHAGAHIGYASTLSQVYFHLKTESELSPKTNCAA